MPIVSQSFKNVVTTGVSAAPGEFDEAFATCFEGQWHSIRSGEVPNTADQACDSPTELSSSITKKGHPRIQRIQIVAPTGEELDRLRQAVELDRELLAVRKQLLAVEKERCFFSASALGLSPRAEQPYDVHSYHVGDRSAALSEEHVRTCTAFDEAVLTMRRGYSLEAGAVVHSMAEDRCDAHGMPHEALGINCHAASSSRMTPMGAACFVPPFFADHTSTPAAAAPPDPGRPPNTHGGDPPFAAPRAGLTTLPTVPSHHLDMPSPRPQVPFRSIDTADEPNQANNTAPLPPGPSATAFSNGSTTSASYSSAFHLRTHRTFNSEPAPRTRRSSTSSHFPPVPSADRGCAEVSKLSRVFRTAIHCLPPGSAIIDHAHVLAAQAGPSAHAMATSAELGCRRSVADAMPSVDYAASGGHGSGPLQPLVPHAAHEPACLPPDVPIVDLADVEAAVRAYEIQSSCMDDMHDCSSEIKRGPPGSREEAGGQQCLELLRGAHLRPWSVTAESVFSRLRSLSINHTTGHDYCAALAPHLEAMAGLKSLDMSNTELCAAGAAALAPRLPGLRSLKRLNLSGNRLGSEGVRALAPVLARLPSLRQLDIRDNGVAMHALHEVEAMLSGDVVLLC